MTSSQNGSHYEYLFDDLKVHITKNMYEYEAKNMT